ncbi:MFS transporter [Flaviaesturariibacter flavus]|uniref:MFS transporter n=1 Tax=Flaviaesturariibacter flavus TaxID=2502780 RepID=A0A4R1BII1_9BACT|nr:MFS transporter [Flaviaesturariibacter flavus]TCJ17054.1 MFS transporter [Flaviaesturariibacter flavus]
MQLLQQIAATYKRSFSGLSRETWLLATVILINRCGFMAVPFMSLYVTQHLHRSTGEAGLIIALFGVGSVAGAATGGFLTDRFGPKPVQIGALVTGGALFLLFSSITHFGTLCALALVIAFFTESFRPANFAATHTYARPGTNTRSYALNRLAMNIGWAVGSGLGGVLASINYRLLFLVDGGISIIAGGAILLLLPAVRPQLKKRKAGAAPVRRPWQDAIFLRFMTVTTLFATCFFLMFRIGPVFFKERWGLNESVIGLLLGLNGVIIALFEMVLTARLEKRPRPLRFAMAGALLLGAAYLFLALPASAALLAGTVSMLLFTVGEMFALPFLNSFVLGRADESNRGQYAAGYTLCWSCAQVIGPAGGFFLAEHWGYGTLWLLLTLLLAGAAWGYGRVQQHSTSEQALATLAVEAEAQPQGV